MHIPPAPLQPPRLCRQVHVHVAEHRMIQYMHDIQAHQTINLDQVPIFVRSLTLEQHDDIKQQLRTRIAHMTHRDRRRRTLLRVYDMM